MSHHHHTAIEAAYRASILRAAHELPVRERIGFLRRRIAQLKQAESRHVEQRSSQKEAHL